MAGELPDRRGQLHWEGCQHHHQPAPPLLQRVRPWREGHTPACRQLRGANQEQCHAPLPPLARLGRATQEHHPVIPHCRAYEVFPRLVLRTSQAAISPHSCWLPGRPCSGSQHICEGQRRAAGWKSGRGYHRSSVRLDLHVRGTPQKAPKPEEVPALHLSEFFTGQGYHEVGIGHGGGVHRPSGRR